MVWSYFEMKGQLGDKLNYRRKEHNKTPFNNIFLVFNENTMEINNEQFM